MQLWLTIFSSVGIPASKFLGWQRGGKRKWVGANVKIKCAQSMQKFANFANFMLK